MLSKHGSPAREGCHHRWPFYDCHNLAVSHWPCTIRFKASCGAISEPSGAPYPALLGGEDVAWVLRHVSCRDALPMAATNHNVNSCCCGGPFGSHITLRATYMDACGIRDATAPCPIVSGKVQPTPARLVVCCRHSCWQLRQTSSSLCVATCFLQAGRSVGAANVTPRCCKVTLPTTAIRSQDVPHCCQGFVLLSRTGTSCVGHVRYGTATVPGTGSHVAVQENRSHVAVQGNTPVVRHLA